MTPNMRQSALVFTMTTLVLSLLILSACQSPHSKQQSLIAQNLRNADAAIKAGNLPAARAHLARNFAQFKKRYNPHVPDPITKLDYFTLAGRANAVKQLNVIYQSEFPSLGTKSFINGDPIAHKLLAASVLAKDSSFKNTLISRASTELSGQSALRLNTPTRQSISLLLKLTQIAPPSQKQSFLDFFKNAEHIAAHAKKTIDELQPSHTAIQSAFHQQNAAAKQLHDKLHNTPGNFKYGYINCHDCNGTTQRNCPACKGSRICKHCTAGFAGCPHCKATAFTKCFACNGSGSVLATKTVLDAQGNERIANTTAPCSACKGAGKTPCRICRSGRVKCSLCRGSTRCPDCAGKGSYRCTTCVAGQRKAKVLTQQGEPINHQYQIVLTRAKKLAQDLKSITRKLNTAKQKHTLFTTALKQLSQTSSPPSKSP